MNKKYTDFDLELKKQCLKSWIKNNSEYRKRDLIGKVLYLISILVIAGFVIFFLVFTSEKNEILFNIAIGAGVGVIAASLPFGIGHGLRKSAQKEYGEPFSVQRDKFLNILDNGLQYGYHDANNPNHESLDLYQIFFEDMNAIRFDEECCILTIIGAGELLVYDDVATNRIDRNRSQRKFYGDSPFEFMLTAPERKEIAAYLNSKAVHPR